jgi:hypothetical protein
MRGRRSEAVTTVLSVLVLAGPASAAAQVLDLSRPQGVTTVTAPVGEPLTVTIVNLAPGASYDISVLMEIIAIPPLDPAVITGGTRSLTECAALGKARDLTAETDETQVGAAVQAIQMERKDCSGAEQREIDLRLGPTRRTITSGALQRGEQIRVVVKKNVQPSKTWSLVLSTGAKGSWRALYGMALGPGSEEKFFTMATDQAGKFVITPEREDANDRWDLAAIPAVYFQFIPLTRELKDWAMGPTLGLGVKSDLPAFFFGGVLTYNQNLGIAFGLPVYQEWKLRGEYSDGQVVGEVLTDDVLHKHVLRFQGFFIAGVFRFSSNPFGGGDNKKEPASEAPKK